MSDDVAACLDDEGKAGYPLAEKDILIEIFVANIVPDCSQSKTNKGERKQAKKKSKIVAQEVADLGNEGKADHSETKMHIEYLALHGQHCS